MTGPYTIKWGQHGGPCWPEERTEEHLDDALAVAAINAATIFDSKGDQVTREDIEAHQHPYRRAAEEIVGTLMAGMHGRIGWRLEIQDARLMRLGSWSSESAVAAVERCLEGSGL